MYATVHWSSGNQKNLRFRAAVVAMVFGIPYGKKDIHGSDGNINEDSISARNKKLGMDLASPHSLCTAEDFLKRNITEESSKLEKDGCEIAFVIFVMGHVISQSCEHD